MSDLVLIGFAVLLLYLAITGKLNAVFSALVSSSPAVPNSGAATGGAGGLGLVVPELQTIPLAVHA